jgi:hypothetical protein
VPCRYGSTPEHRVLVELVEANIEIGFRLVEMLESGPAETSRLVAAIEDVYADLLARVNRLQLSERENFESLVTGVSRFDEKWTQMGAN